MITDKIQTYKNHDKKADEKDAMVSKDPVNPGLELVDITNEEECNKLLKELDAYFDFLVKKQGSQQVGNTPKPLNDSAGENI